MRSYSNRNIDPDPLAPSVFHRMIMPPLREAPYRTSQATALRFLLHCVAGGHYAAAGLCAEDGHYVAGGICVAGELLLGG
jgi:hypothetical protein